MSHHGQDKFPDDLRRRLLDTTSFRGATGLFPEGRLSPADEGQLQFALSNKDGKVVLEFGTPVAWVGLNPQQAADLASGIIKHAREAARASGQPLSVSIG